VPVEDPPPRLHYLGSATQGITRSNFKLIRSWSGDRSSGNWEFQLYSHESDPIEQHNLRELRKNDVRQLNELLVRWMDRYPLTAAAPHAGELGSAALDALAELGYVDGAPNVETPAEDDQ
jgi:hypothetical protein